MVARLSGPRRPVPGAAASLVCLLLFAALALLARVGALAILDAAIVTRVQVHAPAWLLDLGRVLSLLGNLEVEGALLLVLLLAVPPRWRRRLGWALAGVVALAAIELLVKRVSLAPAGDLASLLDLRPAHVAGELGALARSLDEGGYPSGHVARATLLLGVVLVAALRGWGSAPARLAAGGSLLGAAALMGITRVALPDEHLPSEVLGGYLLGLAALPPTLWLAEPRGPTGGDARPTSAPRTDAGPRAAPEPVVSARARGR